MNKKIIFMLFFISLPIFFIHPVELPFQDQTLGNKWYSSQSFYVLQGFEFGVSGSKDFLSETFLFSYAFRSKNRHSFSIRNYHIGNTTGILTNSFEYFNFAVMAGFEYMYKLFTNTDGLFVFTDIGGCDRGVALNAGIGLGNRVKDGFEMDFTFLQNTAFFSRIEFYFLFFDAFIVRGELGIDLKYRDTDIRLFTFLNGIYLGFSISNYFRLELGGGFTVNDNMIFNGYGGAVISMKFPR
jgi:hypothetical protein